MLPMFDAGHELPLGRRLIAPASDQDVEDMAVLVDRTPQIMTYAIDGQKHLIEMSCVPWSRAPTPELVGIGLPKLSAPRAHGLVRQHDPTFCRISSTWRWLRQKRKYSHTLWLRSSAGNRWRFYGLKTGDGSMERVCRTKPELGKSEG